MAPRLLHPAEQAGLARAVDVLLTAGLRPATDDSDDESDDDGEPGGAPAQRRAPSGPPPLRFAPPVHTLARFPSLVGPAPRPGCPPAVRQVLLQSLELESIRRAEAARKQGPTVLGPRPGDAATQQAPRTQPSKGHVPLTLAERLQAVHGGAGCRACVPCGRDGEGEC